MSNRCFVTNFDENYFEYACVLLRSLGNHYKKPIKVICMVPYDLRLREQEAIEAVDREHLDIEFRTADKFDSYVQDDRWSINFHNTHHTRTALIKLFISSICHDYDEAVYVDSDAFITADPTDFIEHKLYGQKIVAYAEDTMTAAIDIGHPERAYFNSGVFIADLNAWREGKLEEAFTEWAAENHANATHMPFAIEQTAFNAILYENWFPMSGNFNCFDSFSSMNQIYKNPVIVHFRGPAKPWTDNINYDRDRGPYDLEWRRVYDEVWGIENLWRPNLDPPDPTMATAEYDDIEVKR